MSDDWKNNPRLSGMDPQKLSMLQGLADQGLGKNPSEPGTGLSRPPSATTVRPRSLRWIGTSLWVGDPCNATRIELTDRGTRKDVQNWPLPKDGWSGSYHCGIVSDGLGRVYIFQPVVQGDDLPMGGRPGDQAPLPSGRIRPPLRSGARPRHRPHLHDPRRQRQVAGEGMPAGAGHGHRAVPNRRPARNGRGAETSLVYRRLAAGAGKWRDPL